MLRDKSWRTAADARSMHHTFMISPIRRLSRAALSLLLAFPLSAQQSRDSAGIHIIENPRPAWSNRERLELSPKPQLIIGNTTDSAYRFSQIRGVIRLNDGRIAVADGGSRQLRIFDARGQFVSASGGRGREPGQLQNMGLIVRLDGDTIAIDAGQSLALFSSTGQFVRSMTLPRSPDAGAAGGRAGAGPPWLQLLAVTSKGSALATAFQELNPAPRSVGSRWTESMALRLVARSGDSARKIGSFPALVFQQTPSGLGAVWLSPVGTFAAGADRFYAGFGDRYQIHVYADDGKLTSIIRRQWTPTPITDDDWEQWVVEWSKLWVKTTGAERERAIQKVRDEPWAESNPAFSQFIVDRDGRLWVRTAHWQDAIAAGSLSDYPAVPSTWSVFDVSGRWLGDVDMPKDFKAFDIGPNYVAGVQFTSGSVQVAIYGLGTRNGQ